MTRIAWGTTGDKPIRTWYSNGQTEVGVFRPSTRQFIIHYVPTARYLFGLSSDTPITGKDWEIPPVSPTTAIINAHQTWRNERGSPTLAWSSSLETTAQRWATYMATNSYWAHSPKDGYYRLSTSGENIFWSTADRDWTYVISDSGWGWAGYERQYFKYGVFPDVRNTVACASGHTCTGDWQDVGHYTQVIWKTTTSIGCGKAYKAGDGYYYCCQYSPAGNVIGQYPY